MGPVWDFNLGFGNVDYCEGWDTNGSVMDIGGCAAEHPFWWDRLLDYGPFDNAVRCRYQAYRNAHLRDEAVEVMIGGWQSGSMSGLTSLWEKTMIKN